MSREIKFRAWDKEKEVLMPVKLMDFSEWWVSCNPIGANEPLAFGERNSFNNEQTDRHIIMQYTGLKDKNGKLIFEGDIVGDLEWTHPLIVSIEKGHTVIKFNDYGTWHTEFLTQEEIDREEFNICGNIYEHPELLGEKHE